MDNKQEFVMGDEALKEVKEFDSNILSTIQIAKSNEGKDLDFQWLSMTQQAVPYIDKIFANPKMFLKNEEETIKIEKIKKTSTESVKDLVKHASNVDDFNEETGDVRPSKLLNVLKEDTYNTYENRFLFTLIEFLETFLDIMEQKLNNIGDMSSLETMKYTASTIVGDNNVNYDLNLTSNIELNMSLINEALEGIAAIKHTMSGWRSTEFWKRLVKERVIKVTSPIKRTNVILKNPSFQIAVRLWDFLHKYDISFDDNSKNNVNMNQIPREYESMIRRAFRMHYYLMKMLTANTDLNKEKYKEMLNMESFGQLTDAVEAVMRTNDKITKEQIVSIVSDHYDVIKKEKVADLSILENKIKLEVDKYLEKIDGSYFNIGGKNEKGT